MMDLTEAGPLELAQTMLLILAAAVFFAKSVSRREAGMPLLMVFAIMLGLGALREFDSDASGGLGAYLDTLASRWHFLALMGMPLFLVVIRNRHISPTDHFMAVMPIIPIFVIGMVLAWLAATVEGWRSTSLDERQRLLIEEVLEVIAYAITLAAALWHAVRSGRSSNSPAQLSRTSRLRGLLSR